MDVADRLRVLVGLLRGVDALPHGLLQGSLRGSARDPAVRDDHQEADADADGEPHDDVDERDGGPRHHPDDGVIRVRAPRRREVLEREEEREEGDDDDGGERAEGEWGEEGRGHEEGEEDEEGGHQTADLRLATGAVVDEAAWRRLRAGEAEEEGRDGVCEAVRNQLLIGVDRVAVLAREDLRHGDGDGEADDGDDERVADVQGEVLKRRHSRRRHSGRDVAHDANAEFLVHLAEVRYEDGDGDNDELRRDRHLDVALLQLVVCEAEADQRDDAEQPDDERRHVDVGDVLEDVDDDERDAADAAVTFDLHPEHVRQLAGGDVERGARHEAADERRRHERREHSEAAHAHEDLDDSDEQGDGAGDADLRVVEHRRRRRVLRDLVEPHAHHLAVNDRPDEETRQRHRAERDVARRAEEEVEDDREEGAVEAVDGRH